MAYCKNCGEEINYKQAVCLKCGVAVNQQATSSNAVDSSNMGWGLLGFCFPFVGLILYIVWINDRPWTAKAVGTGALISVIIGVILSIFFV